MSGNESGSVLFLLLPLAFLGYVFWTQRRRIKQVQAVQGSVVVGDQIRTTAGLFGTITALSDTEMSLEVAPGVVVRYDRRAVDAKISPAAPASPVQD
ncbi:MAG: preprotein translocase subunit YajC [Dermatophilaceae bacterium]|nr:preprotein translocase subunit YajC [Actinomycetales bacterium]MBP8879613.1 preprotein translocase subunit YajC [Dermatophilaceae bacterium]MBP9916956.1 preprotein translocase subunit YajC [Dermatophilaceae bacterium]